MTDTPVLHNKEIFREILSDYQISQHAKEVLAKTPFVALSGMAGGGRNSIIDYLVENYNYIFAISDTTRPPKLRDGRMEQDGVNYYFRTEEEMLEELRAGEFVEAEIIHEQQVSGTSIREIERTSKMGRIPIHDFEYLGIKNVYKAKPDAVIIGLIPPDYDEWLRRLRGREVMQEQEFLNRLTTAEPVLENILAHDYFRIVVNDTIDRCANDIRHIVEDGEYSSETHERGVAVTKELLGRVRAALEEYRSRGRA